MKEYSAEDLGRFYVSLPQTARELVSRFVQDQCEIVQSDRNVGDKPSNLTHSVSGRLVFEDGLDSHALLPIHNIKVELWDQDFGHHHRIGLGRTDRDGRFAIWYDPSELNKDSIAVQIRVYDREHCYRTDQGLEFSDKLVFVFDGQDEVSEGEHNLGELAVPYWTYDSSKACPRLHVVQHGSPPQSFPLARSAMLLKNAAAVEVKNQLHHAEHALNRNLPTPHQIQSSYPQNLTLEIEKKQPGYTRSDEYFGERMLNGMCASVLDRDPSNLDRFWLHHHWDSYAQSDEYSMPNVDIWFELSDQRVVPVEIAIQMRRTQDDGSPHQLATPTRFSPSDGPKWEQAKRVARVSAALHTELDAHLVETHLNVEQYAIATYRNFRCSPLRELLAPHVKEVVLINREAERRLLNQHSFLSRATAFTPDSLKTRIRQTMGTLDWKNWKPRRVLCEQHTYAKAAGLFWESLSEYVDFFFEQHATRIKEHWYEVQRFSDDIVRHSLPFYLCPFLSKHRDQRSGALGEWFEPNERMDLAIERRVIDGVERAIHPVTESSVCDTSSLENIKQLCRYVIFHATFKHSWANSKQYDDGGELLYSGVGLRHGNQGIMTPEEDHSILPPPDLASDQLWYAWMLSTSCYGFITKNEDRDIHPQLIQILKQRRGEFAALGLDINSIQSRINI